MEKRLEKIKEDKESFWAKYRRPFGLSMEKMEENKWLLIVLGLSVVFLLTFLLIPGGIFSAPRLAAGDVAQRDIKAPVDLIVKDEATIRRKQQAAEERVFSVYDLDSNAISQIEAKIASAFEEMRAAVKGYKNGEITAEAFQSQEKAFIEKMGIPVSSATLKTLLSVNYNKDIQEKIVKILSTVMERGVIADRYLLEADKEKGIITRTINENREGHVKNLSEILDVKEANKQMLSLTASFFPSTNRAVQNAAAEICTKMLGPNLVFNKNETEARKKEAVINIKPLFYKIKKGDTILRNGQRVAEEHIAILGEISKYQGRGYILQVFLGIAFLASIIIYTFYRDIMRYKRYLPFDLSKFLLISILIVGNVAITKLSYFLFGSFAERYEFIDNTDFIFAIPVVIGPMLAAILFDIHIAIVFSFINSLLIGMAIKEEPLIILFSFIGGIVAAFSVIQCKKRSALQRAGLFVGLINILMIIAINLYNARVFTIKGPLDIAFGLSGGFIASTMVSGLLSLLESSFKITTNFKLLELLDLNQPILRQLFVVAPGTYHHSMVVSTLTESAAEAIKVNPLLARVAAYYHDIGKITKPEYFIENQMTGANRHDNLAPSMSSLILISHVKDGVELAKEHRLPKEIIDIIQQHHGTRIITYFYNKAQESRDPNLPSINEMDYRYHGPKPQTKIAAIVLLADAVEASSRLLADPTPARISNLVEKIVKDIFVDEQLNECDLTLRDLSTITNSFVKALTGIFHHRIDYPGMKISDYGAIDEDTAKQQAKKDKDKVREIRRIGPKGSAGAGTY